MGGKQSKSKGNQPTTAPDPADGSITGVSGTSEESTLSRSGDGVNLIELNHEATNHSAVKFYRVNDEIFGTSGDTSVLVNSRTSTVKPDSTGTTTVKPDSTGTTTVKPDSTGTTTVNPDSTETTTVDPDSTGTTTVNPDSTETTTVDPDSTGTTTVKPDSTETTTVKPDSTETTTVKPDSTEITTVKPDSTETTTVKPDSTETTTVKPDSTGTTTVKPDSTETTTVKPDSTETTTVKPDSTETTTVKPDSTETTTVKPDSTETTTVKPDSTGTTTVKPDSTETTTVKPDSTETTTVKPDSTETTTVKPDSTETTTVKPDSTETTTVKPYSTETTTVKPDSTETTTVKPDSTETTTVKPDSTETTTVKPDSTDITPLMTMGPLLEKAEEIADNEDNMSEETSICLGFDDSLSEVKKKKFISDSSKLDTNLRDESPPHLIHSEQQSEYTVQALKKDMVRITVAESSSSLYNSLECSNAEAVNTLRDQDKSNKSNLSEEAVRSEKNKNTLNTDKLQTWKRETKGRSNEWSSSSDEECLENSNEEAIRQSSDQEKVTPRTEDTGEKGLSKEHNKVQKPEQRNLNPLGQVLSSSVASIAPKMSDMQPQKKSSIVEASGSTSLTQDTQSRKTKEKNRLESQQTNITNRAKSTIVFAKLDNYNFDFDICSYINYRFPHSGIFRMDPYVEHETRSTIVAIHCQSKRAAQQVTEGLHKGNGKSETIIWCFNNMEEAKGHRVGEYREIQESFQYHLDQLTERAEKVLSCHYDKICEVEKKLERIDLQKRKHMSLQDYAECQNSICAFEDKKKELTLQRDEFLKSLREFVKDLNSAKESCKFESKALFIRQNVYVECNRLTNSFPIYARRSNILEIVQKNQVCVVIGETGSGKSTQLVQYFYQAGLADNGLIACTQPRKIAATSLATHVAKEMGTSVGQIVGYKVGMQVKKTNLTKVLYMTDHILLNECLEDKKLSKYSCIIIDEAHERSIHTDLLLGMIKDCLKDRPELKVIITSATINEKLFVEYFKQCPVLHISGRMFPVEVEWEETSNENDAFSNYEERATRKAIEICLSQGEGDILVFLTKPIETERCCALFQDMMRGRQTNYVTLPLHGRLQGDEQQRVFDPSPPGKRKIVFATNIAETSVTIKGIKYVIDTGLVNEMKYDAIRKISTLAVTMVSQSSANQRKGRAGRLGPGNCYRLYSENEFKKMTPDSLPEILKVHISHAILKLMELGVNPMEFDFVESPSFDAMDEAINSLIHIGAVENKKITELGKWIVKMPFDPSYGAFVHEAVKIGLGVEAVVVAAASGTGSVFYRGGSSQEKELADKRKITFCHEEGDQMTALGVFREWSQVPEREKNKWCMKHSINGKSVRGIRDMTREILDTLKKELMVDLKFSFAEKEKVDGKLVSLLFRALNHNLSHYLGHMKAGFWIVSKDQRVEIHPSSSLFALGIQPEWIVYDKVMRTTKNFAMQITPVPENVVKIGIEEGWLTLDMEKARKKQITIACQENVGSQLFREVVGPRYVDLQSLEAELVATCPNSVVVVEADQDKGELRVLTTEMNKIHLENSFLKVVPPIRAKYKSEESEEHIGSATDFSERAVLGTGGSIVDILLPGEYKAIIIFCSLDKIDDMSEDQVQKQFRGYGSVKQCIKFFRRNKKSPVWGKVVYEQRQAAIKAVEANREDSDLTARPNSRIEGNRSDGYNTKIQWCRRPSRGFGFVGFTEVEDFMKAIQLSSIYIVGRPSRIRVAKPKDSTPSTSVHVGGLGNLVTEDVLREAFASALNIDPINKIQNVMIIRERVNLDKEMLDTCKRRLRSKLEEFSLPENFHLDVREPRTDRDVNFMAYCSFQNPEDGHAACTSINNGFMLSNQAVTMKANIYSSILIHRDVYKKKKTELDRQLKDMENDQIRIKYKELKNGNLSIQLTAESADSLANTRSDIQKVIQGEVIECENKPELITLFSYEGRKMIQEIMNRTHALILMDNRVMSISIHGLQRQCLDARTQIENYAQQLKQGNCTNVDLMGGGKPPGVMKTLMLKYKVDLGKLQEETELAALKLDHRRHRLRLFGSEKAIAKATDLINQIISSLTLDGGVQQNENHPDCITCFCPVEPKDMYRLEVCGHPYCKECIQLQMDAAISSKDFPIQCGDENCSEMFAWKDFVNLSRLGYFTIARLVSASVSSYVSEHRNKVRFCTTPDCPAVYRVSETGSLFSCPECGTRLCTSCHVQYHDGMSCVMFRDFGCDGSLMEWIRQDKANRKNCPGCNTHIEKTGGCNKVTSLKAWKNKCREEGWGGAGGVTFDPGATATEDVAPWYPPALSPPLDTLYSGFKGIA
ncbi:hypothetical protein Pmani_002587 [Petrolisthes manimaculis]|uniref:RNA helicase n=1 Tax=Petrolisthes manimaculis TaxID=1843537 RepID=A0AAE1QH96_9EUCA|nr:hypothetical protein Pmani_002587 [Petrolisthes manimaculis]